ncbi:MAG: hypothetical protein ACFE8B_15775 [Candidatus Hermodarchaeota archaeon]
MNETNLKEFLEENKKVITTKNMKKILKNVYKRTENIDPNIVYDFLGDILVEKPELLEDKNFSKTLKAYNDFSKNFPSQYNLEKEKYLIENYCLFENENILKYFLGSIGYKRVLFKDRVFITNYRIIIFSEIQKPSGGTMFMPWAGLIFNMVNAIENKIKKALHSSALKSAGKLQSINKPLFGYQFPIIQITDIRLPLWKAKKFEGKINHMQVDSKIETDSFELRIFANMPMPEEQELYKELEGIFRSFMQ